MQVHQVLAFYHEPLFPQSRGTCSGVYRSVDFDAIHAKTRASELRRRAAIPLGSQDSPEVPQAPPKRKTLKNPCARPVALPAGRPAGRPVGRHLLVLALRFPNSCTSAVFTNSCTPAGSYPLIFSDFVSKCLLGSARPPLISRPAIQPPSQPPGNHLRATIHPASQSSRQPAWAAKPASQVGSWPAGQLVNALNNV